LKVLDEVAWAWAKTACGSSIRRKRIETAAEKLTAQRHGKIRRNRHRD
jgi:hypothetical protein